MSVFQPNLTSRLILSQALKIESLLGDKWLEIGAGSGWITSEFRRLSAGTSRTYFISDISSEAISLALEMYDWLSPDSARVGSGLDPWLGEAFDVIVNDIAGISDPIAQVSDWYAGVTCDAGRDGLGNVRDVLKRLPEQLAPSGVYLVPLISLSDYSSHIALLKDTFADVSVSEKKYWPLPEHIVENESLLNDLATEHCIEVLEKYGRLLAWTAVAVAREPYDHVKQTMETVVHDT